MMGGDKYRSASLSKCRSDSAADGTCSVHHCRFVREDIVHSEYSFRYRRAPTKSTALVANECG